MISQGALLELFARLGAARGEAVFLNDEELNRWPAVEVAAIKSKKLLVKARPASSAICPGCERTCIMAVHNLPTKTENPAPFIVCDKRSDINRVSVDASKIEQWEASGAQIAIFVRQQLRLLEAAPIDDHSHRWQVGILQSDRGGYVVTLAAEGGLTLNLAGHHVALSTLMTFKEGKVSLNERRLTRLANNPTDQATRETPEQRCTRLRLRVREEKARGTKAFRRVVADEEGISISRLSQIINRVRADTATASAFRRY